MVSQTSPPERAGLDYQELGPDDILTSVESLGYRCDGRFLTLNSYENRVYRVGLEEGSPVVAKFYRPGRWSDEAIREEHDFVAELSAHDIPVVAPFRPAGASLHHHTAFRFAVYPCHGGRAPDLDDLALLRQLGQLVGRIHLVGAQREHIHRPRVDLPSYGEASHAFLLDNGLIPPDLEAAYVSVCVHVFDSIRGCYARAGATPDIRVHADFHPSNVLVGAGGTNGSEARLHIVDFDDTRNGPAIQDLWMFLSGDRVEQAPQLEQLVAGYTTFRPLDARELHLIEALRTLRLMHYTAWLARRWHDPAFPRAFPWFDSRRYWDDHVLALREQIALMEEEPLAWPL